MLNSDDFVIEKSINQEVGGKKLFFLFSNHFTIMALSEVGKLKRFSNKIILNILASWLWEVDFYLFL